MPSIGSKQTRQILGPHGGIKIDWRQYFYNFCEQHGPPVPWQGKLLFQDGWQYSNIDYSGPEYRPPTDPQLLLQLQLTYWRLRRNVVTFELAKQRRMLQELEGMATTRSAQLMQVSRRMSYDERAKEDRITLVKEPLDLDSYRFRVQELQTKLDNCNHNISVLSKGGNGELEGEGAL